MQCMRPWVPSITKNKRKKKTNGYSLKHILFWGERTLHFLGATQAQRSKEPTWGHTAEPGWSIVTLSLGFILHLLGEGTQQDLPMHLSIQLAVMPSSNSWCSDLLRQAHSASAPSVKPPPPHVALRGPLVEADTKQSHRRLLFSFLSKSPLKLG